MTSTVPPCDAATGKSGAAGMRGLVQSVAGDGNALSGLRKAAVDSMPGKFTNADGSIAGATMIRSLTENRDTLAELFAHEQRVRFGGSDSQRL